MKEKRSDEFLSKIFGYFSSAKKNDSLKSRGNGFPGDKPVSRPCSQLHASAWLP
tara:strand:+ start:489 stop:650 length:162 start_codon:yes stop_codon:yes gene_type:complete